MAYNNYFPQTYAPASYVYGTPSTLPTMAQTTTAQNTVNAINWVQGEAGAKSVPVQPGQKVLLMDSETNVFYVKSCDISGMPLPLRVFEYTEVSKVASGTQEAPAPSTYVTHEELERILADLQPSSSSKSEPKEEKKHEFLI